MRSFCMLFFIDDKPGQKENNLPTIFLLEYHSRLYEIWERTPRVFAQTYKARIVLIM